MPPKAYSIDGMPWEVEFTSEFGEWWDTPTEAQQEDVGAIEKQLEARGPLLPFPYSSGVKSSRHGHMRELRVQSGGHPLRVFYTFDPRQSAILLIGGDKTGNSRFYETYVPIADGLYDVYIAELKAEGLIR